MPNSGREAVLRRALRTVRIGSAEKRRRQLRSAIGGARAAAGRRQQLHRMGRGGARARRGRTDRPATPRQHHNSSEGLLHVYAPGHRAMMRRWLLTLSGAVLVSYAARAEAPQTLNPKLLRTAQIGAPQGI